MILILLATILILAIAFYQVVQGLFSAMITAILTVLSAALAFTYYEPLAEAYLYTRQPAYAEAVSLVGLFVVPLIAVRVVLDRLFHGNVVMGTWADRIAGGAVGLFTGMVQVGVLLIALQMLPIGGWFMYYKPFTDSLQRDQRVWPFCPDEFTLGLIDTLSSGGLGLGDGENRTFGSAHDDLLRDLFCARNTAGKLGQVDALPDTVKLVEWRELATYDESLADAVPDNPLLPKSASTKLYVLRVALDGTASNDKDKWYRLPATHFRLVTTPESAPGKKSSGKPVENHYPVAYLTFGAKKRWQANSPTDNRGELLKDDDGRPLIGQLIVERPLDKQKNINKKDKALVVDWVYRLPLGRQPRCLVFRRIAVRNIGKMKTNSPMLIHTLDDEGKKYMMKQRGRRRK